MAEEETPTQRSTLVAQSDTAYDLAVAIPVDDGSPVENAALKVLALLEVLVAESRLDRYDRENPTEVAELSIVDILNSAEDYLA